MFKYFFLINFQETIDWRSERIVNKEQEYKKKNHVTCEPSGYTHTHTHTILKERKQENDLFCGCQYDFFFSFFSSSSLPLFFVSSLFHFSCIWYLYDEELESSALMFDKILVDNIKAPTDNSTTEQVHSWLGSRRDKNKSKKKKKLSKNKMQKHKSNIIP